jgi:UDP-N-acetylmuramoyl-tripeptide--D-alanyl-D-alanine ligase
MQLTTLAIAELTGGHLQGDVAAACGVSTDSRRLRRGELFVALVGDRFDGHDFLSGAQAAGAAAALVSRPNPHLNLPQIVVGDTLQALGLLGKGWRARFNVAVIAVTGSNGKTTVKDMLAGILRVHAGDAAAVLATEGNLNNAIGLPLMLLRLTDQHRYAVFEMGMNHLGEIDYLTRLAQPKVALVNNAQRAHIGELGSQDKIAEAKGEIYAGLEPQGIAIVNADDRYCNYWLELNAGRAVLTFGQSERAQVRGVQREGERMDIYTQGATVSLTLQVPGEHNVKNALAAAAAAQAVGVPLPVIAEGLTSFEGAKGRLQRKPGLRGATILDDTYNANPDSAKAGIRVLVGRPGRTFLVLGDMGELGAFSREAHAEVGQFARKSQVDQLFALGNAAAESAQAFGDGGRHFADLESLIAAVLRDIDSDVTVLVKGSRFMQMERVVERLVRDR